MPYTVGTDALRWDAVPTAVKTWVAWLADHTGVPALIVASVLIVFGYRTFRRTMRFAFEVSVVAALLAVATHLGWIRW